MKRSGVRVHDIFNEEVFERKLRQLAAGYKKRFGDLLKYDVEEEIARFKEYRTKLAHYTTDAVQYMKMAQDRDYKILIEGANALMLDIDYGNLPLPRPRSRTDMHRHLSLRDKQQHRSWRYLYRPRHQPSQA